MYKMPDLSLRVKMPDLSLSIPPSLPVILLPPLSLDTLDCQFSLTDCSHPTESRLASEFRPIFSS